MGLLVRADFYPNGTIIPLCVTFSDGKSIYIKNTRIKEISCGKNGKCYVLYNCHTDIGNLSLKLENNIWSLE